MLHEQLARERQNWADEVSSLKAQLNAMESDFAQCAKQVSPCFFCAKDDTCDGNTETCNFKWKSHN